MLNLAICDDEEYYRRKIEKLLAKYCDNKNIPYSINLFSSGLAFLSQSENLTKFDAVFMDISMEELDGIQTALCLRNFRSNTQIVFVTAFISYAIEGYKADAVRYLMKDTLPEAVPECMDAILLNMQLNQVTFPFPGGAKTLYTDNILYIESKKHKVVFYYLEASLRTFEMYEKLDNIENRLTGHDFLRIHKSYLVNLKHIEKISNYTVRLNFKFEPKPDTAPIPFQSELPVPRLRYQSVKESFVDYKGML